MLFIFPALLPFLFFHNVQIYLAKIVMQILSLLYEDVTSDLSIKS